jgi:hypothetical protein
MASLQTQAMLLDSALRRGVLDAVIVYDTCACVPQRRFFNIQPLQLCVPISPVYVPPSPPPFKVLSISTAAAVWCVACAAGCGVQLCAVWRVVWWCVQLRCVPIMVRIDAVDSP